MYGTQGFLNSFNFIILFSCKCLGLMSIYFGKLCVVWARCILGQYDLQSETTLIPKAIDEATENFPHSNCLMERISLILTTIL